MTDPPQSTPDGAGADATVSDQTTALDAVETLFDQLSRQVESLKLTGEPSLAVALSEISSKSLLLAAASRFESQLEEEFVRAASELSAEPVVMFCINQGVHRKYHTLFDWTSSNINRFIKLFGESYKDRVAIRIATEPNLQKWIASFLYIGNKRNELVHEDFAAFPLDDTLDELIEKYREARSLLPALFELLEESDDGVAEQA